MRITTVPLTADATGAYRVIWPMRHLGLHGHTILMPKVTETVIPETGRILWAFDVDSAPNPLADVWVIQMRWEQDWTSHLFDRLRQAGSAIVIECDDNYIDTWPGNPSWKNIHPYRTDDRIVNRRERRARVKETEAALLANGMKVPKYFRGMPNGFTTNHLSTIRNSANREWGFDMMRRADSLIVSTPFLAERYSMLNKDVQVVRNYLEWELWENITPQYEEKRDRLRVGYLGAFGWRKHDLEILQPWIANWLKGHRHVDFVANSNAVHDFLGIPYRQRVTIGEYMFYQGHDAEQTYVVADKTAVMDIGLIPLQENAFNEGKSHLKGMEYNAAGIPYVQGHQSESYRYWTEEGRNGVTVTSHIEWMDALDMLVEDETARHDMGRYGREKARQHSLDKHWEEWQTAVGKALGPLERQAARHSIKHGAVQKVPELEGLLNMVSELRPKVVVEVGSARGGTIWGLSQVCDDGTLFVSIDMPAGSPIDVRNGEDVYGGRDRDRIATFVRDTQKIHLLDGDSQDDGMRKRLEFILQGREIDFLFIDADHRYSGVKRDYELYSPLVRKGGLIAFHDVIPQSDVRSGVHTLWAQIKKRNQGRWSEHIHRFSSSADWGGIGVVRA